MSFITNHTENLSEDEATETGLIIAIILFVIFVGMSVLVIKYLWQPANPTTLTTSAISQSQKKAKHPSRFLYESSKNLTGNNSR